MTDRLPDDQLYALTRHAEWGHLEGQDYDAIVSLLAEVKALTAERDRAHSLCIAEIEELESERDRLREQVANPRRDAGMAELWAENLTERHRLSTRVTELEDGIAKVLNGPVVSTGARNSLHALLDGEPEGDGRG